MQGACPFSPPLACFPPPGPPRFIAFSTRPCHLSPALHLCRMLRGEREIDEAISDENPWGWVRKKLQSGRGGYKPWFRPIFALDQIELRYRDINTGKTPPPAPPWQLCYAVCPVLLPAPFGRAFARPRTGKGSLDHVALSPRSTPLPFTDLKQLREHKQRDQAMGVSPQHARGNVVTEAAEKPAYLSLLPVKRAQLFGCASISPRQAGSALLVRLPEEPGPLTEELSSLGAPSKH